MKSRAERLEEILEDYAGSPRYGDSSQKETKEKIIAIFKECAPEEKSVIGGECGCMAFEGCGCMIDDFNKCRTETLKNIEELVK